jgi:signal peptidase
VPEFGVPEPAPEVPDAPPEAPEDSAEAIDLETIDIEWPWLQKAVEALKAEEAVAADAEQPDDPPDVGVADETADGEEVWDESPEDEPADESADDAEPPDRKKSPLRRAFSVAGTVLTVGTVAFVVFLFAVLLLGRRDGVDGVSLFGYRMFMVLSGSMEPEYPEGSVVFTRETPVEEIAPGDVITFYSRTLGELITHRVVSVEPFASAGYTYVTKGDANEKEDSGHAYSWDVVGTVRFKVPLLGYAVDRLRTVWGLIFLVILPATIIIVVELIKLIRFSKE